MIKIRPVAKEDLNKIHIIANQNSLSNINSKDIKNGFLVPEYSGFSYSDCIEKYKHFYVLTEDNIVRAFLLGYEQGDLNWNNFVNKRIKRRSTREFALIKQICVDRDCFKRGFASMLYTHFIDMVKTDIYLAVVLEPYNEASIEFHNSLGFEQVMQVVAEDGKERGVFYKSYEDSEKINIELLLQQYNVAIDLYKHEDDQNWSKLNHLFYVTGGLLFVTTFAYDSLYASKLSITIIVISLIALIITYLFDVTMIDGIDYLQKRKKSVIEIEEILSAETNTRIVSTNFEKNSKKYQKSKTTSIMIIIPKLFICTWLLIMLYQMIELTTK